MDKLEGLLERHRQILWEKSEEGQKAIKRQENLQEIQKYLNANGIKYTAVDTGDKVLFRDKKGNLVDLVKIKQNN